MILYIYINTDTWIEFQRGNIQKKNQVDTI